MPALTVFVIAQETATGRLRRRLVSDSLMLFLASALTFHFLSVIVPVFAASGSRRHTLRAGGRGYRTQPETPCVTEETTCTKTETHAPTSLRAPPLTMSGRMDIFARAMSLGESPGDVGFGDGLVR